MEETSIMQNPSPDKKDIVYAVIKGAVSEIPIAGGVASELISLLILPPLEKRREEWITSIAQGLVDLQEKVDELKLETLSDNEVFITSVMQATQAAVRNHQEEKLEALRNAVLNSALPNAPEEDLQFIFINFVDELTTWHLRILKPFDDPIKWADENNITFPSVMSGSTSLVLEHAYPELKEKKDFYLMIFNDLGRKGLAGIPTGMMTESGMRSPRTTTLGRSFLQFISLPPELNNEESDLSEK